jgi:uncharacterized protein (DUF4415 family)
MSDKIDIIPVTDEEDREITEAALADPDAQPLTAEELAAMRPAREVLGAGMLARIEEAQRQRRRGPQKAPTKEKITIRLDPDVIEHFRDTGPGWQSRMNEALRDHIGLQ